MHEDRGGGTRRREGGRNSKGVDDTSRMPRANVCTVYLMGSCTVRSASAAIMDVWGCFAGESGHGQ